MNFLEALKPICNSVSISILLFTNSNDLRRENQHCLSISHPSSASPGCSHQQGLQHSTLIPTSRMALAVLCLVCLSLQGTSPALCLCGKEQPSPAQPAILAHHTPAGTPHSPHSSGISLPSALCINQAAGRLRNMTNTLAGISPAVKTQEEGGY